ncbi:unnamed protein product [Ectocarpus sp. 4 AP-2014]
MRMTLDVRVPRSAIGGGVCQSNFARRNYTGGPSRGASSTRGRSSSVGGRTGQPSLLAGRGHGRDGGAFGRSGAGASDGRGRASSAGGRAPQSGVTRRRGSGSASGGTAYGRSSSGSSDGDGGYSTTSGAEERHETGVGGVFTFTRRCPDKTSSTRWTLHWCPTARRPSCWTFSCKPSARTWPTFWASAPRRKRAPARSLLEASLPTLWLSWRMDS